MKAQVGYPEPEEVTRGDRWGASILIWYFRTISWVVLPVVAIVVGIMYGVAWLVGKRAWIRRDWDKNSKEWIEFLKPGAMARFSRHQARRRQLPKWWES